MPTIRFSRPFSAGSRPTPDPFDKYLDSLGLYRKHTARDSSNLFRVISEQLYDTQDHFGQIRKDCVNYMIKHRDQYESMIDGDFDSYIRRMAKPETAGTMMELRVMGSLFKRNIKLYRPFQCGEWFAEDPEYKDDPFLVFYASHFDTVFNKTFVIDAAFCQSIVYEVLYKNVYKLPDIEYSVETMLHNDINHEPVLHEYDNGDEYASHIVFEDGRKFQLDRPENTECILSDREQCHFHNEHFEENAKQDARRYEKSILSDKFSSCVRQLLFDGITPFPYKVAKSLDENIYRNVEFDSWNEERKILRNKSNIFNVGDECLVQLNETKHELLKCRVRESKCNGESYVVFVSKLAEKRLVASSSLRLVSGARREMDASRQLDYAKSPYAKDYLNKHDYGGRSAKKAHTKTHKLKDIDAIFKSFKFKPYINLSNFEFAGKKQPEIIAYPMIYTQSTNMNTNNPSGNAIGGGKGKNRNPNQSNQVSDVNDKQPHQASKADDDRSYGKTVHETKSGNQQMQTQPPNYYQPQVPDQNIDGGHPNQQHVGNYIQAAPVYYYPPGDNGDPSMYQPDMAMPHGVYMSAPPMQPNMYTPIHGNQTAQYPVHVGGWPAYNPQVNPQGFVFPGPAQYSMPTLPTPIPFQFPFLPREMLRSAGRINFSPNYAMSPSGEDLPLGDKVSTRFYYNLGVEYYKLLVNVYGQGQLMCMMDGELSTGTAYDQQSNSDGDSQQNQMVSDFQQMNFEANEMEIPSPTKQRNDFTYRRATGTKYKRNDNNRPIPGKQFQGSFAGPTTKPPFSKNGHKYSSNQNNSGGYDETPIKDNGKAYHQGSSFTKREQYNPDTDVSNANISFGLNVPPFPFGDPNEQHFVQPGSGYTRITTPVSMRPTIQPVPLQYVNQAYGGQWMAQLPPNTYVAQQQHQQQSQSQQQSLNNSGGSNPSM